MQNLLQILFSLDQFLIVYQQYFVNFCYGFDFIVEIHFLINLRRCDLVWWGVGFFVYLLCLNTFRWPWFWKFRSNWRFFTRYFFFSVFNSLSNFFCKATWRRGYRHYNFAYEYFVRFVWECTFLDIGCWLLIHLKRNVSWLEGNSIFGFFFNNIR